VKDKIMTDDQHQIGISPGRAVWWGVRFIGWIVGAYLGFWIILFAVASIIAGIATVVQTIVPPDNTCITTAQDGRPGQPGIRSTNSNDCCTAAQAGWSGPCFSVPRSAFNKKN
jgi:hypothetical protein